MLTHPAFSCKYKCSFLLNTFSKDDVKSSAGCRQASETSFKKFVGKKFLPACFFFREVYISVFSYASALLFPSCFNLRRHESPFVRELKKILCSLFIYVSYVVRTVFSAVTSSDMMENLMWARGTMHSKVNSTPQLLPLSHFFFLLTAQPQKAASVLSW